MGKYGARGLSVLPLWPFIPDPKMPLRQKHSWPFVLKFLSTVSIVICFEVEDRARCLHVGAVLLKQPLLSKKKITGQEGLIQWERPAWTDKRASFSSSSGEEYLSECLKRNVKSFWK